VDDVREVGVDERSSLLSEGAGEVGDAAYPPDLDLAVEEALPDLGKSVAGLDRVGEQHPAGVGRPAQGGGELDDCELRDLGCAGAGELEHGVGAGHPEPGHPGVLRGGVGVVVGEAEGAVEVGEQLAGGVAVRPLGDRDEPVPDGLVGSLVEVANLGQQVTSRDRRRLLSRVVLVPECHVQSLLEHQFERNRWMRARGRICGGRIKRNPSEHPSGPKGSSEPQPSTEIEVDRKQAFDK